MVPPASNGLFARPFAFGGQNLGKFRMKGLMPAVNCDVMTAITCSSCSSWQTLSLCYSDICCKTFPCKYWRRSVCVPIK